MTKVTKVWHISMMTHDLKAMDRWFKDLFSPRTWMEKEVSESLMRDASMHVISDLNFEPFGVTRVPGAEASQAGKFYNRHGPRYHSLALFLEDPVQAYEALKQRNLMIFDIMGGPMREPPTGGAMYTHPKQSFGMFELVPDPTTTPYPRRGEKDPRWKPDFSTKFWRDEHPLGILHSSHLTILVEKVEPAVDFYQGVLGGKLLHQQGQSAFLALGDEVVVELAAPSSERVSRDLIRYGEGLYAVTYKVKDLGKAVDFLTSKGMLFESRDDDTVMINRGDSYGSLFAFTDRNIPNDSRA